ncbi:hypothetical protein SISNIDRAFT_449722 [Sistotremastrum niveocremeum HHB9708]|uniref:Uncharacterized protein n=1 Tax=Sistotremastrum niveocremeum HHB9708 TaxID=1314777 RepID=A0A164ZUH2_9AGAM|nr:hypothetical protein SISNIDRAFT_449722 [Sistotremastrum niveocremeum HHB9708]
MRLVFTHKTRGFLAKDEFPQPSGYASQSTGQDQTRPSKRLRGAIRIIHQSPGYPYSAGPMFEASASLTRSNTAPGPMSWESSVPMHPHNTFPRGQTYPRSNFSTRPGGQDLQNPSDANYPAEFPHGPTDLPPRPYNAGEGIQKPTRPKGRIPGSALGYVSDCLGNVWSLLKLH